MDNSSLTCLAPLISVVLRDPEKKPVELTARAPINMSRGVMHESIKTVILSFILENGKWRNFPL